MRLRSFRIQNYKSIKDTEEIEISDTNNIFVLAGQNESGKSAILKALQNFEEAHDKFHPDSKPFTVKENPVQTISCTYFIEEDDSFKNEIIKNLTNEDHLNINLSAEEISALIEKLRTWDHFTLTMTDSTEGVKFICDNNTFPKIQHIIDSIHIPETVGVEGIPVEDVQPQIVEDIPPEVEQPTTIEQWTLSNEDLAEILFLNCPQIVFFDDFCSLLPNQMYISDLSNSNTEKEGYDAVRNVEAILDVKFETLHEIDDGRRDSLEDAHNKQLSIDFQKYWHQKIYGNNQVKLRYDFQKRDGEGESGSYLKFYVVTKEGQNLSPAQRSKGLIWFLSLWLELRAKSSSNRKVVLLLDEPDQHLHIKAQEDMLGLINYLANDGMQILYSTHSPYLIDTQNLGAVRLIANTETQGTKLEKLTNYSLSDPKIVIDAIQPISDAIGMHADVLINQNLKKCILLEGLSDFFYLNGIRLLLGVKDLYNFLPSTTVNKIPVLISFCIGYGKKWRVISDDGTAANNIFNEVRNNFFEGNKVETEKSFMILKGVNGIENLFTYDDLKLIESTLPPEQDDKVKVVGKKRKIYFANRFLEKVRNKEIKIEDLNPATIATFKEIFKFIKKK